MSDSAYLPLAGIRVIDFSHVIAGPLATFYLAQMGAEVIKIERPGGGDVLRRSERGDSAFLSLNAGKRSVVLDLDRAEDFEQVRQLVREADVFVDNFRPGSLERRGLGYEAVRELRPDIIYCTISGFGRRGEWSGRLAYDHVVQAATGMAMMAGKEGDDPIKVGFPVIDAATGMQGAMAIMSALMRRQREGKGALLDVSMAESSMQLMYSYAVDAMSRGVQAARVGNQGYSGSPSADFFRTRDGWIALGANTPPQFDRLLGALGLSHLREDREIFGEPSGQETGAVFLRVKDPARLKALLAARIQEFDARELETLLCSAHVPAAKVRRLVEFVKDAEAAGVLRPLRLAEGDARAVSPGIGFLAD